MNKNREKFLPIVYILVCAMLCTWGFGALSATVISALLCAVLVKNSFKTYALHCLLSSAALLFAFGTHYADAVAYIAITIFVSLTLGMCILYKKPLSFTLIASSLVVITILCALLLYFMKTMNTSAVNVIFGNYMTNISALQGELSKEIQEMLCSFSAMLDLMLPAILVLTSAFLSYISLSISRAFLSKWGITVDMRKFSELRLWGSFTFIFIILDLCMIFIPSNPMLSNVSIILTTLFVVCGVSVIDFYLKMKNFNTAVRIIIYIAGFLVLSFAGIIGSLAINVLHFVGLIDSLRPLRHVDRP